MPRGKKLGLPPAGQRGDEDNHFDSAVPADSHAGEKKEKEYIASGSLHQPVLWSTEVRANPQTEIINFGTRLPRVGA